MTLSERIGILQKPGIIPVVRLDSGEKLAPLISAFEAGGIRCVELTMTMPDALAHLKRLSAEFQGRMLLGMGTILSADDAEKAVSAGAGFLVSPVPVDGMAEAAHRADVPVVMGAFTPMEAFTAHNKGADFVKIFPLSLASPKYLKTIREPMPFLRLIPSGSITLKMLPDIFASGAAACCVGGDLVRKDLIAANDWQGITEQARLAVQMR